MKVFKDPDKLGPLYVPEATPHREVEVNKIISRFRRHYFDRFILIGSSGSGKTLIMNHVARQVEEEGLMHPIYIDAGEKFQKPYDIMQRIYNKVFKEDSRGLSLYEMFRQFLIFITRNNMDILLLLDDSDHLFSMHQDFLFMLSRPEEAIEKYDKERLYIMFSVRSDNVFKHLDIATLSSLRIHMIKLDPYTYENLVDITGYRCSEAFNEGAYYDEAVETAADIAIQYSSNARVALDLMYKAGMIAEEEDKCVEPEHVRYARNDLPPVIVRELDVIEKVLLYSLGELLLHSKAAYAENKMLEAQFLEDLEYFNLDKINHETYMKMVKRMDALGFISLRGGKGKAYIVGLPSMPAALIVKHIDRLMKL